MPATPRRDEIQRQLRLLARLHTRTFHPGVLYESWDDGDSYFPDGHPAYTYELLVSHFNTRYVAPLGRATATLLLRRAMRRIRVLRVTGCVALVTSIVSAPALYGWLWGPLLGGAAALGGVLSVRRSRRTGARLALRLMDTGSAPVLSPAQLTRVLRRRLDDVDASAVCDVVWGPVLMVCIAGDETEREIMRQLADQYHGTVGELLDTSRALAR